MTNKILDWVDYTIEQQHTLLDIAANQPLSEIKYRAEGFLEALYCMRDFIISSKDL